MVPQPSEIRSAIDRLDRVIAELVAQRTRWAQRTGLAKSLDGRPILDPVRERRIRDGYDSILRPAGWSPTEVTSLLEPLLGASRRLQSELRVSIQGGPGSWSDESLAALFPDARVDACETFREAWQRCHRGDTTAVWFPTWNSIVGPIEEANVWRADGEVWFEYDYPVRHVLVGAPGQTLEGIRRIEGHPRAIQQCKRSLETLVPLAECVEVVDGAFAAEALRPGSATAVLGSPRLTRGRNLCVLTGPVSDRQDNTTRFCLIARRLAM